MSAGASGSNEMRGVVGRFFEVSSGSFMAKHWATEMESTGMIAMGASASVIVSCG